MRRENTSAVAAAVISATIADHTRSSDARGPTTEAMPAIPCCTSPQYATAMAPPSAKCVTADAAEFGKRSDCPNVSAMYPSRKTASNGVEPSGDTSRA